ncbi:MAG TPA: hypothetical protein VF132_06770 [Rudaea sp.]
MAIDALASGNPAYAARCDGCSSQNAKAAATAIAYLYKTDPAATAAGYYGYVYSYDFAAGTIEQYGVVLSTKLGQLVAMPIGPAPAEMSNAFHTQRNAVLANGPAGSVLTFHDSATSHPDMPYGDQSAFEIVQTGAMQNTISAWMLANAPINGWAIIAAVEAIVLKDQPLVADVVWTMPDNTHVTMEFVAGTAKFKLIEASDANLNPIPLVANDVPGKYVFRNDGGAPFSGYLHDRFGYTTSHNVCANGTLACTDVAGSRACEWITCGKP